MYQIFDLRTSILSCLFLLFVFTVAWGQSSEADFILLQKDFVLNANGSVDMRCRQIVKYNTHISFNRLYGETFIVYNPQQQQLKINESYTVQADGNKITTPPNAFNEVLPRFAADAPDYHHLREMVITHTGLEIGATAYLDYSLHSTAGYMPELDRCLTLQEESPIKEYKISVTVPDTKKLTYQMLGAKATPKQIRNGNTTRYEWTLRDIAASSREYYQPEDGRNAPHLLFSTWPSQRDALQWLSAQIKADAAFDMQPKSNADTTLRFADAYQYVTERIAYTPIPVEYAGYRFRDAAQIIKNACGTAGEKAALLVAIAKRLGVEARCVVVYPSYVDGSVGSLHAIADVVVAVAVNPKEEEILLSPVKYTQTSLSISRPNWRYVPLTGNPEEMLTQKCNQAVLYMEMLVNPIQVKTSGYSNMTSVTCGTTVVPDEEPEKHKPGTLSVHGNDEFFSFTLPEVSGSANAWGLPYLGAQRQTTLEIPYPIIESYSYTIWATASQQIINRETTVEKANALGSVHIQVEKRALNYYLIKRSLELRKSIIAPSEYPILMELMSVWRNPAHRTVMFR